MKKKLLFSILIAAAALTIGCSDSGSGDSNSGGNGTNNGGGGDNGTVNSYILFAATDAKNGRELWRTDGTSGGTVFVKDIWAGPEVSGGTPTKSISREPGGSKTTGSSKPENFTWFNNKYYFSAIDGDGVALWVSDGTEAGTQKVTSNAGWSFFSGYGIMVINNKLYFTVNKGPRIFVICESDGTAAGTRELKISTGVNTLNGLEYGIVMNGKGYFVCNDGGSLKLLEFDNEGQGLLKRAAGTESLASTDNAVLLNGKIYFVNEKLVYSYDGAAATTLTDTTNHPNPVIHGVFNEKLFFSTYVSGTGPFKLWVTDGAEIKDLGIIKKRPDQNQGQIAALNEKIYYISSVYDSSTSKSKYFISEYDGIGLKETELNGNYPRNLIVLKSNLYFTFSVNDEDTLYRYNGTAAPEKVSSKAQGVFSTTFQVLNGRLIFAGYTEKDGLELWVSDGTDAGTGMLKDIFSGSVTYEGKEYGNNSNPFIDGRN